MNGEIYFQLHQNLFFQEFTPYPQEVAGSNHFVPFRIFQIARSLELFSEKQKLALRSVDSELSTDKDERKITLIIFFLILLFP